MIIKDIINTDLVYNKIDVKEYELNTILLFCHI